MTFTALLLVGGLSQRMNADKTTLLIQGEPLWSRQLRLLRQLNPDALLVSARARPAWSPAEVEVVIDVPPSCGPLSGLSAALQQLSTSHLLALAIDLPLMNLELLRKLCERADAGCGIIPQNGEWFEPLCAVYPAAAAAVAQEALKAGDFSLQHLAGRLLEKNLLRPYPVTPDERSLFTNVNTAEDLVRCQREP